MVTHSHNMQPTRCAWRNAKLKCCGPTCDRPPPLVITYPALYQLKVGASEELIKKQTKCIYLVFILVTFIIKSQTKENMKREQKIKSYLN